MNFFQHATLFTHPVLFQSIFHSQRRAAVRIFVNTIAAWLLVFPYNSRAEMALEWVNRFLSTNAPAGINALSLEFHFRNSREEPVTILSITPSCGCTYVNTTNSLTWTIAPGSNSVISAQMNLAGRRGLLSKSIFVKTSHGMDILNPKVMVTTASSPMPQTDRLRNRELAKQDKQAVFRGHCATCHAKPTAGKFGRALFDSACGICHEAEHQASIVPNLRQIAVPDSATAWKRLISRGKPGTLMPAFTKEERGPLNDNQIDSLVDFMMHEFSNALSAQFYSKPASCDSK